MSWAQRSVMRSNWFMRPIHRHGTRVALSPALWPPEATGPSASMRLWIIVNGSVADCCRNKSITRTSCVVSTDQRQSLTATILIRPVSHLSSGGPSARNDGFQKCGRRSVPSIHSSAVDCHWTRSNVIRVRRLPWQPPASVTLNGRNVSARMRPSGDVFATFRPWRWPTFFFAPLKLLIMKEGSTGATRDGGGNSSQLN